MDVAQQMMEEYRRNLEIGRKMERKELDTRIKKIEALTEVLSRESEIVISCEADGETFAEARKKLNKLIKEL